MSLRLPTDEYAALRRTVLDRDGWKCRRCYYRQNLDCHHIIFRSEMGEDATWNLVTLCNECHAEIHDCKLYITAPAPNFVGEGGGADGKLLFLMEDLTC